MPTDVSDPVPLFQSMLLSKFHIPRFEVPHFYIIIKCICILSAIVRLTPLKSIPGKKISQYHPISSRYISMNQYIFKSNDRETLTTENEKYIATTLSLKFHYYRTLTVQYTDL